MFRLADREHRGAEVFGTVIVSCAPAMSTFWNKILAESTLWSKTRSTRVFLFLKPRFAGRANAEDMPSFVHSSPQFRHKANIRGADDGGDVAQKVAEEKHVGFITSAL